MIITKQIPAYRALADKPNLKFEVKKYAYKNSDYIGVRNPLTSQEWRLYFTSLFCCDHDTNCTSESVKNILKPTYRYDYDDSILILTFDFEIQILDISDDISLKYRKDNVDYTTTLKIDDIHTFKNYITNVKNVNVYCTGLSNDDYDILNNSEEYWIEYEKPIYFYEYINVNANMNDIKNKFSEFDNLPFQMKVENNNLFFVSDVDNPLEFVYRFCRWTTNEVTINGSVVDQTKKDIVYGKTPFIGGCVNKNSKVLIKKSDIIDYMYTYSIRTLLTSDVNEELNIIGKPLKFFTILDYQYPFSNCLDSYYSYGTKRIKIDNSDNYVGLYIDEFDGDEIEILDNNIELRKNVN